MQLIKAGTVISLHRNAMTVRGRWNMAGNMAVVVAPALVSYLGQGWTPVGVLAYDHLIAIFRVLGCPLMVKPIGHQDDPPTTIISGTFEVEMLDEYQTSM